MQVLVTGGTGFIGGHLLEALTGKHEIHALVRSPEKIGRLAFADKINVIRGDLHASEEFPAGIEAIIQLAAITKAVKPSEFLLVNQQGASRFLDRASRLPNLKKIVQLSSLAAAGPSDCDHPLTEEVPPHPVSLYGKSKLIEEETFRAKSPAPLLTIRAPIVFGPGDGDMLDGFRLLKRGFLPLLSSTIRRYSVIYVKDLVRGIMALLDSDLQGELFYLTNPDPIEWSSFMQTAARLLGRERVRRVRVPRLAGRLAAEISEWRCRLLKKRAIFNRDKFREMKHPCWLCSGSKAERLLHFAPHYDLEAALAETIQWYRSEGLL